MTESDMIRAAWNAGSYAVVSVFLLLVIREIAHKLIDKLIEAIKADTKAKIEETAAMARLSEKIDASTKRKDI